MDRNVSNPPWFKTWFGFSEEQDKEVKDNFMGDYEKYVAGEYSGWDTDKDGRLAATLICDQFSRQLFRKQAKAFDTDKLSIKLTLKALKCPDWPNYAAFEKLFFLMVLMHQESVEYTNMQVTEMTKVDSEYKEKNPEAYESGTGKVFQQTITMGKEHGETIQKFGRYPYRNEVLGRESPEELEYLKSAKTYGQ